MGLGRFELPTSSMSTMRSNQLSYKPLLYMDSHSRLLFNVSVAGILNSVAADLLQNSDIANLSFTL